MKIKLVSANLVMLEMVFFVAKIQILMDFLTQTSSALIHHATRTIVQIFLILDKRTLTKMELEIVVILILITMGSKTHQIIVRLCQMLISGMVIRIKLGMFAITARPETIHCKGEIFHYL